MAWVHVLSNQDYLKQTAFCEACGPVEIRRSSGRWRCINALRAMQAAERDRLYGPKREVRAQLADLLIRHGIPDTDTNPVTFDGLTVEQANWLLWVARAGIDAITTQDATEDEGDPR